MAGAVAATAVVAKDASAICGAAGIAGPEAGLETVLETLTSAGFGDCREQALAASSSPRITKLAIIASFCWRDQDVSVAPEIALFVACFVDF